MRAFICILQILYLTLLCQKKYARMFICSYQYQMDAVDIFLLVFFGILGIIILGMLICYCALWFKRWKYYMRHPFDDSGI